MPDASLSVHRSPFPYHHPVFRASGTEAKARSRGHCQNCGRKAPLEAHHWGKAPYPPPRQTTAAALTALCVYCHIKVHLSTLFEAAGGSPEALCGAWSEIVATLLLLGVHLPGSPTRVGRPVWAEGQWVALITGPPETRRRRGRRVVPAFKERVADRRRDRSPRRVPGVLARAEAFSSRTPVGVHHDARNRRLTNCHPASRAARGPSRSASQDAWHGRVFWSTLPGGGERCWAAVAAEDRRDA